MILLGLELRLVAMLEITEQGLSHVLGWYAWTYLALNLVGLMMIADRYRRSSAVGLFVAVMNSLLVWLPAWDPWSLPPVVSIDLLIQDVHWSSWSRMATLLVALLVAIVSWAQRRQLAQSTSGRN
jgi:hypothetical protein